MTKTIKVQDEKSLKEESDEVSEMDRSGNEISMDADNFEEGYFPCYSILMKEDEKAPENSFPTYLKRGGSSIKNMHDDDSELSQMSKKIADLSAELTEKSQRN